MEGRSTYEVHVLPLRHAHHARASGYDRLVEHLGAGVIPEVGAASVAARVAARLGRPLIRRSGSRWYQRDGFIRELRVARQWLRGPRQLFHFLYGENSFRYTGALKRLRPGNAIVCTYHTPPQRFRQVVTRPEHLRHIDALVVLSTMALDYFGALVGPERVFYIPRGVDSDWFTPGSAAPRAGFQALFVGSHLRDFACLAAAARALRDTDIRLQVVTFPAHHHHFAGLANVELRAAVDDYELLRLYRTCDALALPLLDATANNVVVEALACGLPVVATDLTGVRDYVSPDCALLTPPGDPGHLAAALRELGVRVRVLGPTGWRAARGLRLPYPVHRWPTLVRAAAGAQGLRRRLRQAEMAAQLRLDTALFGCDLIHAHTTYPNGYLAARLRRRRGPPLVVTPHGVDVHLIPRLKHGLRLEPELAGRIRLALGEADAVTAISDAIAESAVAAGAPRERLHRIANGVDVARFAARSHPDPRPRLGLPAHARLLVSVGNHHPRKGQEVLVHAMARVVAVEPRACALIVGRGSEVLRPLIVRLGLVGQVVLVGPIPFPLGSAPADDLLAAIHAHADCYISAGTEEGAEGLSLALLEAMAAGNPPLATDISGNRDLVRHGRNGLLVRPNDPEHLAQGLLEILTDTGRRRALGAAARATAQGFSWRGVAGRYLEVYEGVLGLRL